MSETSYSLPLEIADGHEDRESDLAEIQKGITRGRFPEGLFDSASSEDDLLMIYGKWRVVGALRLDGTSKTMVKLCTKGLEGLSFERSVVRQAHSVYGSAESFKRVDIELAASVLGVYDYIWPPEPE